MKTRVETDKAPQAVGPYSQAVERAGLLFVSGQLGMDPDTGQLPEKVEDQAQRALLNLRAILEAAGVGIDDVVKTTIYLVDMNHFPRVNEVYARHFTEPYPARATVAVKALPKGALVEIDCIAIVD